MSYLHDMAAKIGIPYRTLWGHVEKYGLTKAIQMHERGEVFRSNARVYKGKTMSQWARDMGMTPAGLSYRVKTRGWQGAVGQ